MAYSNQRITKIKRDTISELLQRAEAMDVEDACVVVPAEQTLTPYPDADQTRTWIRDYLLKGINGIIPIDTFYWGSSSDNWAITRPAQTYISTVLIDGLPLYVYNHKIIDNPDTDAEFDYQLVTKPGLMLSNLLCPVSFDAGQGSYIRQANSTNAKIKGQGTTESYNCRDFRSLYHGHYGYTFLNRGIIHRESGSTHDNNDSYMLHYSPLPNSSTSYEGMLIPGTLFQNSYTNIQTICYPTNPSMQGWSDTSEKTLQFTAINNNTDNSNNTTTYNGRFVGEGWSFEINASGNHAGSGSNWGSNPTTGPNSSNGICVNGEIVYSDITGTECHQLIVDWCAQTVDADNNVNNPNANHGYNTTGNNIQGPGQVEDKYSSYTWNKNTDPVGNNALGGRFSVRDCNGEYIYDAGQQGAYRRLNACWVAFDDYLYDFPQYVSDYTTFSCRVQFRYVQRGFDDGHVMVNNNWRYGNIDNCYQFSTALSNGYRYLSNIPIDSSNDFEIVITACPKTEDCFVTSDLTQVPQANVVISNLRFFKKGTSNKNVNIYLNIIDRAKQYEEIGLSWNYTCNERDRFTYTLSTAPCTEDYCSSNLLYENVSITPDGDFAEDIPDVTIKG